MTELEQLYHDIIEFRRAVLWQVRPERLPTIPVLNWSGYVDKELRWVAESLMKEQK